MIVGHVDEYGRSLVPVTLRATDCSEARGIDVWVDTGFTGELVLSATLVRELQLTPSAIVTAALADGSKSVMETYSCEVEWFGVSRTIEVIANSGQLPLLGVGLLLGHRLVVDYDRLVVTIE